ncbi:Fungal transcriptional regulatory protein [Akanthomyces lecanii RCEF 1005]|uniref:Fungal transcriptional regulatory protein n=1 Tax=Akanthomyces lecanii RCEF 1005 TaxID=1081108 RepID=A0A162LSB2_CORDF|nr:Fungal transcriptional regulatory protein [Akanthomyces lecanii RCEF 1005]
MPAIASPEPCRKELQRHRRLDSFPSIRPSSSFLLHFSDGLAGVPAAHAWEVVCHANRAIHGAYFDDHYTILVPFLPLIAEFPSYAYTWLALGAAQLAQQHPSSDSSHWRLMALECHSKAISGLRRHLESTPVPQEWALCCMLLLHIFEKFGDGQQWPSDAHVKSARGYFLHRFAQFPPTNMRHILQLESLIYRIAVTSLFQPREESSRDCTFLDKFVDIWAVSSIQCGLWRHSLWIGLQPSTFNAVFKLSVLLRQVPLNELQLSELERVAQNLPQHLPSHGASPSLSADEDYALSDDCLSTLTLDDQSDAAHYLFSSACWVVMSKMRNLATTQDQDPIRELARTGYGWLKTLIKARFFSPVLLWPVIILGLAASTLKEQNTATTYVNALAHASGLRASTSVVRLFKNAWEGVNGDEPAGIDMLFNSEALATVFI